MRILFILIPLCMGGPVECTHCEKPLPGLKRLMLGIDLRRFDLFGQTWNKGWRAPLFHMNCSELTVHFAGEGYWQVPTEVSHWEERHKGSAATSTEFIKTIEDVTHSFSVGVEVSGGYGPVTASASTNYREMEQTIKTGEQNILRKEEKVETMKVTLESSHKLQDMLADEFKRDIANLPTSYIEDQRPYHRFLRKYGTHYINATTFGGIIRQETIANSKEFEKTNEKEFTTSASLAMDFALASVAVKASYSENDKKMIRKFQSNSKTNMYYFGGITNSNTDGQGQWSSTVETKPALVRVTLNEIYHLIKDEHLKSQMEMAVKQELIVRKCPEHTKARVDRGEITMRQCFGTCEEFADTYTEISNGDWYSSGRGHNYQEFNIPSLDGCKARCNSLDAFIVKTIVYDRNKTYYDPYTRTHKAGRCTCSGESSAEVPRHETGYQEPFNLYLRQCKEEIKCPSALKEYFLGRMTERQCLGSCDNFTDTWTCLPLGLVKEGVDTSRNEYKFVKTIGECKAFCNAVDRFVPKTFLFQPGVSQAEVEKMSQSEIKKITGSDERPAYINGSCICQQIAPIDVMEELEEYLFLFYPYCFRDCQ